MYGVDIFNDAVATAASKKAPLPKPTPFPRLQKMDLLSAEMPFLSFCRLMARLPNLIHLNLLACQYALDRVLGWKKIFPDESQRQRFRHFGYAFGDDITEEQVKNIVEAFPNLVSLHLPRTPMNLPIFRLIQQNYATNLCSLDLRLCYFDEDVTYQLHLLLCAGKFKNLVHFIAPFACFLISDLKGLDNNYATASSARKKDIKLWQTPQLRVLITSFDAVSRRIPNFDRSAYGFKNSETPSSTPDMPCSCLGPWEQKSFRNKNRYKDPVPQHTCCEASSLLARFLSTQCPLLEVLQIKITPQTCFGYPGLRTLGRLKELRELRIWTQYLDRTKRQDLEWIQDMI
ncbi:hypothetical protein BGZ94_006046, partial [Podila epigama]